MNPGAPNNQPLPDPNTTIANIGSPADPLLTDDYVKNIDRSGGIPVTAAEFIY